MTVIEQIDAIWVRFREQIAEAYKAAYEVDEPAGNSPAWQALCARCGVEHISDTERAQVIAAQKPLRGAPAMELVAVVKVLCRENRIRLKKVDTWDASNVADARHGALMNLIDRTDKELLSAYRGEVLPKPTGMFGNVFATPSTTASSHQASTASAITCKACGGPRLSPNDYTCAYCGNQFA
jgi:hypothetical protein